jgi:predicted phage-related endonuclease
VPPARKYGLTEEQRTIRRSGIGASEAAAIIGRSTLASPMDVWLAKMDPNSPDKLGGLSYVKWGNRLESVVLDAYEEEMQKDLLRNANTDGKPVIGTLQSGKYQYLMCTPDSLEITPGKEARTIADNPAWSPVEVLQALASGTVFERVVQAKTCRFAERHKWGLSGTDEIPDGYLIQVQVEMGVTGLTREPAHLPVLFGGNDFRVYTIPFSEGIFGTVNEACERFWVDHVLKRVPPPVDGSDAYSQWIQRELKERKDKVTRQAANDDEVALLMRLGELKEESKRLDFDLDGVANQIKKIIGTSYGIQARDIGKALYIGGDRQVGSELDIDNFLNGLLLLAQARGMTEEVKALKAEHTKPFEKFTPRKLLWYADKEK